MEWLSAMLGWYLVLLIIGLIFFPFVKRLFSSFLDFGYPFSKTIAILVVSYAAFVLGVLKLVPFTQTALFSLTALALACSLLFLRWNRHSDKRGEGAHPESAAKRGLKLIFFEEFLFLVSLLFLAYVRSQEPSIRGLEKFMDFGFINSILRSRFFPPQDIWLSADAMRPQGYPINYYYFGHLTGAFLIKLTGIKPSVGYNLTLAAIFAQGVTLAFSLCVNMVYLFEAFVGKVKKVNFFKLIFFGLLGAFMVNLSGNLQTIYLFTSGYPNDQPVPFWQIFTGYSPKTYWYPNATRLIPYTIHEFPSYSYVVSDLHGHVFDIPFVLLTLALLLAVINGWQKWKGSRPRFALWASRGEQRGLRRIVGGALAGGKLLTGPVYHLTGVAAALGFMIAVHYMTNAFDGPIYFLFAMLLFLFLFGLTATFAVAAFLTLLAFVVFSLPFSVNFTPFIVGIGLNCAPDALIRLKQLGPFLFERGNCQISPLWMLFVLWGFFAVNFALFMFLKYRKNIFTFLLFAFGLFLVVIPEFFYIKDIYPAHFRANTMFKLGYQAFIMMGAAATFTYFLITQMKGRSKYLFKLFFIVPFFFIFLYPFFSFPSYYGDLKRTPQLDGETWLSKDFPQDYEIIRFLNAHVVGQPTILEAQGDSYTDYERISAYTGLPTVAGWWVHEWLWRGSPQAVGARIPDISEIYESRNIEKTKALLRKYRVRYVVISGFEREKYKKLYEEKFHAIGRKIFQSKNKNGAIYQVDL
ncbi:hypothetical protein HYT33_01275 [Candidatus Roizmanbacteria bacterium]|nr:hypothetical protein [Candidatus Roizmanbacteria bacterium]